MSNRISNIREPDETIGIIPIHILVGEKSFAIFTQDGRGVVSTFTPDKPEWDKFKQKVKKISSNSIIFETKSNLIEHFPKIREKANGFPALLYFNENEFKDFNQETNYERTVNSLLKFFKQNGMLSRQLTGGKSKNKKRTNSRRWTIHRQWTASSGTKPGCSIHFMGRSKL